MVALPRRHVPVYVQFLLSQIRATVVSLPTDCAGEPISCQPVRSRWHHHSWIHHDVVLLDLRVPTGVQVVECRGAGAMHQSRRGLCGHCRVEYHIRRGIDGAADLVSHVFSVGLLAEIPHRRNDAGVLHVSLFSRPSLLYFIYGTADHAKNHCYGCGEASGHHPPVTFQRCDV